MLKLIEAMVADGRTVLAMTTMFSEHPRDMTLKTIFFKSGGAKYCREITEWGKETNFPIEISLLSNSYNPNPNSLNTINWVTITFRDSVECGLFKLAFNVETYNTVTNPV